MPIMTRMRDSMPLILFLLLIAFLITIIFEWGMDYLGMRGGSRADTVGIVNGKKISYKEFSDILKNITDNQKPQGGGELDEDQMQQARDQAWQAIVNQQLIEQEISRLGLTVTDQELVDWVRGENPPEDLRRYFVDSTGQFRRDAYDQFLGNPNQFIQDPKGTDPAYGTKWLKGYESNLRQRRLQEKLQSIVLSSVRVGEGEILQRYDDQNRKFNALYAAIDPGTFVKDEDAPVTDADIKSYYEENIDQFKFEATRKLKYVQFLEKPSAADTASRLKDIEDAAQKAKSGVDFLQLVYTYSDKPDSGAFFRHGELSPPMESAAFGASVGSVVGPVEDADGYHLIKVLGERKGDKEYVHALHILLTLEGGKDSAEVKALAQRLASEARGGKDFAQLAREYSKDPASAQRGGDVGWFTRGRMVPQFENAAFKAKTGEVVGPIRTAYGIHIIKVVAHDARELKLATINAKIAPSSQTKNDLSDRAKDFAFNSKETDLAREAQQTGFDVKETVVQEKGGVIPGIGVNEAISKWAFSNKVGTVSEPFTVQNGFVVFSVAEIKDAGVRPLDEVKESLKPQVLRKKKMDRAKQIAADLRAQLAPGDSLTKLTQLNPLVKVQQTGDFTAGGAVPGIGRDENFIGTVEALQAGQISPPVLGYRGAYLIQLVSKSPFDSAGFASQKEALRARLLQDKRNRFLTDWLAKLKENAEIEDHRELFFR